MPLGIPPVPHLSKVRDQSASARLGTNRPHSDL